MANTLVGSELLLPDRETISLRLVILKASLACLFNRIRWKSYSCRTGYSSCSSGITSAARSGWMADISQKSTIGRDGLGIRSQNGKATLSLWIRTVLTKGPGLIISVILTATKCTSRRDIGASTTIRWNLFSLLMIPRPIRNLGCQKQKGSSYRQ